MAVTMRAVPALAVVLLVAGYSAAQDAAANADQKSSDQVAKQTATSDSSTSQSDAADSEAREAGAAQARQRQVRLTLPWRNLTSLTEDQRRQINQIHRKAVKEFNAIEQREKEEIMALLNDQQKAELTALEEKAAAERKARAAQRPGRGSRSGPAPEKQDNEAGSAK